MKKNMRFIKAAAAALIAAPAMLSAQEGGYREYFALGFCLANGHAHDLTQKTWGGLGAFNAEFGLEFRLPDTGVSLRPNIGMAKMLAGKPTEDYDHLDTDIIGWPKVYDMMGFYGGVDIVYRPFSSLPLSITTGPSLHVWNVDEVDAPGDPNQGSKELKIGWRASLGYEVNSQLRVGLAFTLTEWRIIPYYNANGEKFVQGVNPSRPAYFTVSASYSF